ncbi:MAG: UvrD-helicase domain-containing protein [Candidatus Thiodiazotropha sp. (ex Myrtea sp. 'scaly one' KF741663)]|nr:UvrD-helicase domain-containing protein [Candidatus Thiodiazotropha sp. (ex Myrtea sp. 'scaly one' KF741663)]
MTNVLSLAVAGGRKTQGIIDHCANLPKERNAIIVTFTQSNQAELNERLSQYVGDRPDILALGWYTFLIRDFARPFIPYKFPGRRVKGFNFEGRPYRMAKGGRRFLDSNDCLYACELSRLANELVADSYGTLSHRLECIYDEILIDEVQDLSGHDWSLLDFLFNTSIDVKMVGDIRQSVLSTNPRSLKNKQYKYTEAIHWFRERENKGIIQIEENNFTWRCNKDIAEFSDTIFDSSWQFPKTKSKNYDETEHDGVYIVREKNANAYVKCFQPQCLRNSVSSGKKFEFDFMNFKVAKGRTFNRVLIAPTESIKKFIRDGIYLEPKPAASFYVAVTRAKQSVAIIVPNKGDFRLPEWEP